MLKHEKQVMFYGQKQQCWVCCFGFFFLLFPIAASLFSAFDMKRETQ